MYLRETIAWILSLARHFLLAARERTNQTRVGDLSARSEMHGTKKCDCGSPR